MQILVSVNHAGSVIIKINAHSTLRQFKRLCEKETGVDTEDMVLIYNGKYLDDDSLSMKDHGLRSGDRVLLETLTSSSNSDPSLTSIHERGHSYQVVAAKSPAMHKGFPNGAIQDPAHVRELLLHNPDQLALLKQNNPRLSEALHTGRLEPFSKVLKEQMLEREKRKKQKVRLMNSHPYDVQAQRLIAEEIRQKNVEANMEAAMEYNPETFGSVVMLYINCKVNGYPVKAFVDSGAQTTIMSSRCAERCNIMRLIDIRWAGVAKGVGVQQIIGRIHMVQVSIEDDFLTTSLSILEEQPMDMLLGLDMLRRHECCIDLKTGVLRIGTTGTETRFLSERDLPACARLSSSSDDEDDCFE